MPEPCPCGARAPHTYLTECVRRLLRDRAPIAEVYDQYKHLDALFSDRRMLPDTEAWHAVRDLWAAVKRAVEG